GRAGDAPARDRPLRAPRAAFPRRPPDRRPSAGIDTRCRGHDRRPVAGRGRSMTYLDALRSAVEALRANPMRSLLTMLGIIIGVAAVIAVVAVGAGARRLVIDQIKSLGTNLIIIKPGSLTSGGLHLSNGSRLSLSQSDAVAIARELPQVQFAVPMVRG